MSGSCTSSVRARAKRFARSALALLLALCTALPSSHAVWAQQPAGVSAELQEKLRRPGDLTLKETSLSDALFAIGEQWRINVVVGPEVQGTVSGVFKNSPLQELLDSILLSNGYGYRLVGQSLVVMKLDKVGDLNPMFVTETISIPGDSSPELLAALRLLGSPSGKVQLIPSIGSLLVVDYPDRVAAIKAFAARLQGRAVGPDGQIGANPEGPIDVLYFRPQYVQPLSLEEPIKALLSPIGRVAIGEAEKQVVVVDHAANLARIDKLLVQLDVPRAQVRITALIYDISLENGKMLGINWSHALGGRFDGSTPQNLFAFDSLMQIPAAAGTPAGAMTLGTLNRNFDLNVVIQALETAKDSRLLANPSIVAVDNEPVEIMSVTEIPYQQLTQTSQGGNIGTTAFREAGVKLMVTPHIAADGTVAMQVNPEFSLLTGYTEGDQPQPVIDRRSSKTVVRVANEQTIVIGGLRHRGDNGEVTGIPYLKDIPYVGALFRSRKRSMRESELVVFLTPQLVTPCEPMRPREVAAHQTGECNLEMIPPGDGCPCPTNVCIEPTRAEERPVPDLRPDRERDPLMMSPDGAYHRPPVPQDAPQFARRNEPSEPQPPKVAHTVPMRLPKVEAAVPQPQRTVQQPMQPVQRPALPATAPVPAQMQPQQVQSPRVQTTQPAPAPGESLPSKMFRF